MFESNLGLNPDLASRIRLCRNPVWSSSGQRLYVSGHGQTAKASMTMGAPDALMVETLSMDDLVKTERLEKVDFIKMDIEGSEMLALRGAEQTLRRFKPKLAVCVYHDFKDHWTIPQYLKELDLGYRFYLRHFSDMLDELVLFATTSRDDRLL